MSPFDSHTIRAQRLLDLRAAMAQHQVDAVIVPAAG
jgi:hypothetical protein